MAGCRRTPVSYAINGKNISFLNQNCQGIRKFFFNRNLAQFRKFIFQIKNNLAGACEKKLTFRNEIKRVTVKRFLNGDINLIFFQSIQSGNGDIFNLPIFQVGRHITSVRNGEKADEHACQNVNQRTEIFTPPFFIQKSAFEIYISHYFQYNMAATNKKNGNLKENRLLEARLNASR